MFMYAMRASRTHHISGLDQHIIDLRVWNKSTQGHAVARLLLDWVMRIFTPSNRQSSCKLFDYGHDESSNGCRKKLAAI